ncbi:MULTISPECIES: hypothetical protein [Enterococcus]|uniref:hypothetical protein n=1 Tax=Enterococcus TaxID=1350 RepID=UPI0009001F36|nr:MULTISPECIES: hypothetical protein [Enterococcus]MDN6003516.1 hypothetical protein [Enterococcus sp.]MDN6217135.1 hypothetical protein [Enterococcus sp.]MDN6561388.1 hypothetical protein [Enterococcus sp.]MDN6584808.1 hypothetical protein [Enterococcus sp.]MDN6753269.1 hypothetical protein [Enterococcus sp.]
MRLRPDGQSINQFIEESKAKYPNQLLMSDSAIFVEGVNAAQAGVNFVGRPCEGISRQKSCQKRSW